MFTLLYTGILSTAGVVGVVGSALLIYLGWRGGQIANLLVLNLLALMTNLNAILDLIYLVRNSSASLGEIRNDAAAFSANVAPLIPAPAWAALWALLAVIMLGIAVYFGAIRLLWKK
jgi:hypothetical protein